MTGVSEVGLGSVTGWVACRLWLPVVGAGLVLLVAGRQAQVDPPPLRIGDRVIVDEQMRRSHAVDAADVVILGDSSALMGIDPVRLQDTLGRPVQSLAAIGPVRGPGYVRLLHNYLARHEPPAAIVLGIHPLSLMHPWESVGRTRDLSDAVANDRWPAPDFFAGARVYVDDVVFGGWLDEPLPGAFGEYYGNAASIRRFLRRHRGGLIDPLPPLEARPTKEAGKIKYEMHADGRKSLMGMRELLGRVEPTRIFVALTPVPAHMRGEVEAGGREAFFSEVTALLGLPDSQQLRFQGWLAPEGMTGLTHASPAGRRVLTDRLAGALSGALEGR